MPIDRKWLFSTVLIVAFCCLAMSLVATAQGVGRADPIMQIRIASEGARPPYNYMDNNNELAGFEIDLGRELCKRMNVTCSFVPQDWDNLVPGLLDHQYDAIMAALEITNGAKIAFTHPYVRMPSAFVVSRRNKLTDLSPPGLSGKSIGVEADGAHQAFLDENYKDSDIHRYASLEDAILDLGEGRLDAVIGDKDALVTFLHDRKEGACCLLGADVKRDPAFFGQGIGIGLRREDKTLKSMFEKALGAIQADGTFDKLRAPYFDFAID